MTIDRRYLRRLLVVAGCVLATPVPEALALAVPLFVAGGALHLWAKGCLEQNRRLTTAGPYRFTRNPFYLANALVDAATCLVIGRVSVGLAFGLAWWATYRATIDREEAKLEELFPEAFDDYRARVPRFWPSRGGMPAAEVTGAFSWDNPGLARGQEYARLLGIALGPVAILAATEIREQGARLLAPEGGTALAGVAALAALWIVKLALADVFRRPGQRLLPFAADQVVRLGVALGCAAVVPVAATARPWLAVWPALWSVLAGLDTFRAGRVARRGVEEGSGEGEPWRYFRNAALGSAGLVMLLGLATGGFEG